MDDPEAGPHVDSLERLRQRRSEKWGAHPPDVLPLTVAEMDFALAPEIRATLHEAIDRSDCGYAMPYPDLGDALADFASSRWSWDVQPDRVSAVTDVGVGVVEMLRVLTRPGGHVVINPPVYPPFFQWAPEAGHPIREVPLRYDDQGWRLDLDALETAFAQHPSAYVLCNPHNPVGRVHTFEELAALARLATIYGVPVISDEIHAPLTLPGASFTPFLSVPGAADIAVSVMSASKAWNLAGLKCAAIVTASARMQAVVDRLPPDLRWRIGHLGALATVTAYRDSRPWLDGLLAALAQRRQLVGDLLASLLPQVRWHPPEATYLAWLDCRAIGDDNTARDLFLTRGRVALEPGLRFGAAGSGFVRLNFGTSAAIIEQAMTAMAACLH